MEKLISRYEELRAELKALNYAMTVISWDSETTRVPGCFPQRTKYLGILAEKEYMIETSDEFVSLIIELSKCDLEEDLAYEIKNQLKAIERKKKIPKAEYIEFEMLLAESSHIWAQAKQANDFNIFAPTLDKILDTTRKFASYLETDELKGYDIYLDDHEEGMTMAKYDVFFDMLKKDLVPFVKEVLTKKLEINPALVHNKFSIDKQRDFSNYLLDILCFDKNRGRMDEGEHPCTNGFNTGDVRFTTHFYEEDLKSSILSTIHETGHAIYEQNVNPKFDDMMIGHGASCAIHESQSRLYENMIGRSFLFWETNFDYLKKLYPEELKDVTVIDFYHYINKCEASYIRTEADELTYPIHIMIRYEVEKEMFSKKLNAFEVKNRFDELMEEYLGIKVTEDRFGALQDVHWSCGMIGYFPTYALGSAYSAMLMERMSHEFNPYEALCEGTTQKINLWLCDKIHQYGSSRHPLEIMKNALGSDLTFEDYVNYLKNKYKEIYGI